jgi:predicted esterase
MIEWIPQHVKKALLYFHSAGTNSTELLPFIDHLKSTLPDTYLWAGDGVISGSPIINEGTFYGEAEKRYWFMFPMKDASSSDSFHANQKQVGASLLSASGYVNLYIDQIRNQYNLKSSQIFVSGYQHGACVALSTVMMRKDDPIGGAILIEPYILEALYLSNEHVQKNTPVYCVENSFMRKRTYDFLNLYTDHEFRQMGITVNNIIIPGDCDGLRWEILDEMVSIVKEI